MEFGSIEAIKQCVMIGLGIAVVPAVTVEKELAQGKLAALHWFKSEFQVSTQMIWHKDRWLSPAMNQFLCVTREVLRSPAFAVLHED